MKLLNFTVIKLTLFLIIGIVVGSHIEFSHKQVFYASCIVISALVVSYFLSKKIIFLKTIFGVCTFACIVVIGIANAVFSNQLLNKDHYTNKILEIDKPAAFLFRIDKRLKSSNYHNKYIVEITSVNSKKTMGKILLNLEKDSLNNTLAIGNNYYAIAKLTEVSKPKNPFQFNYNAYLKKRQVYHQTYLNTSDFHFVSKTESIYSYSDKLRMLINKKLIDAGFDKESMSILNAILLGQRQDIDQDIYNDYVDAGTIHILAVSGLHVGIIYFILICLLKPLDISRKGRHVFKPLIIVVLLWAFAFIAGLSPSVTRAVTMFSIICIAQQLKRPTNIYNTLAISAFFILLFNPTFLFEIGFQMSYLAVLAIVSIQPLIYKLWKPKYLILVKPWQIFTVTIAAQIGVAPISLFYFHQFPGLFFISNLVITPFLGLILGFGILAIVLALLDSLPQFLVDSYSFIIHTLNDFIAWVAHFESFLITDISFNAYQLCALYLVIVTGFLLFKFPSYKNLVYGLSSILVFSFVLLFAKYENSKDEFVIFNISRHTIIGEKQNHHLKLHHNLSQDKLDDIPMIRNYKVGYNIDSIASANLKSVYGFKGKTILVIDSLGIYKAPFKTDYVVLRASPKINLIRLIDSLHPKQIIADASNYKSYVARWKATCRHKKIPFHSTYEKGAFILE